MTKNKTINNWYWAGMVCLPIFIYITLVTYFTPLISEDFFHPIGHFADLQNGNSFFGIREAWDYFKVFYIYVGGRIHYFFIGFLSFSFYRVPFEEGFSQTIFAILNGLAFLILLINLFFLAFARKPIFNDKNDRIRLCIIFLLMMTILAVKSETIFWLVGRTNYLWPTTLLSSVAVFFRLAFAHDDFLKFHRQPIKHFLFIILMMPLAVAAGLSDYIGVLVVFGLLLFGLFYKIFLARKKLPLWCYIIFVFFVIGIIIFFIAPGNYAQYNSGIVKTYRELSAFDKFIIHPLKGLQVFLHETFYLPFLILPVFFYWQRNIIANRKNIGKGFLSRFISKMKQDKNFGMAVIFLLSAFGFVAVSGVFPRHESRTFFSGTCIFLLAALLAIDFIFFSSNKLKLLQKPIVKKTIFITSSLLLAIYLSFLLTLNIDFHREFKERTQAIATQKAAGKDTITIKPYSRKYFRIPGGYGIWHWGNFGSSWETDEMAKYYGVKKIIVEEEKK